MEKSENTYFNLLNNIEKHCSDASICRSRIARLKLENCQFNSGHYETKKSDTENVSSKNEICQEFFDEFEYYYDEYKKLSDNFTLEDLLDVLPSRKNSDFIKIVYRLQAESLKEIKEMKEFILSDKNLSDNDLEELKYFISREEHKITLLNDALNYTESKDESESKLNKIVLVPTCSGDIRVINEINHLPIETYDDILELINSIIDGTFKGVKGFSRTNQLGGLAEVRKDKIRVLFTRIGKDTYAIISIFVKKVNTDQYYRDSLKRKYNDYHSVENFILSNSDNSEFQSLNDFRVKELFSILNKNEDEKSLVKGDKND